MATKAQIEKQIQRWLTCLRCGHGWFSAMKRPTTCPRCKSYKWDEPKPQAKGKR